MPQNCFEEWPSIIRGFLFYQGVLEPNPREKRGMTLGVEGHRLWNWWAKYSIQSPGTVSLSGLNTLLSSLSHRQLILRPYTKLHDRQSLYSFQLYLPAGSNWSNTSSVMNVRIWKMSNRHGILPLSVSGRGLSHWTLLKIRWRYDQRTSWMYTLFQMGTLTLGWHNMTTTQHAPVVCRSVINKSSQIKWSMSQKAEQSGGLPCRVRYIIMYN